MSFNKSATASTSTAEYTANSANSSKKFKCVLKTQNCAKMGEKDLEEIEKAQQKIKEEQVTLEQRDLNVEKLIGQGLVEIDAGWTAEKNQQLKEATNFFTKAKETIESAKQLNPNNSKCLNILAILELKEKGQINYDKH